MLSFGIYSQQHLYKIHAQANTLLTCAVLTFDPTNV